MIDLSTLMMFSVAIIVLMMAPGPNMAFVIAHGVSYGWRGGVSAALGIGAADIVLTALTVAGVTAIVVKWPPAINLIRIAGAAYLLYMAWGALRNRNVLQIRAATPRSLGSVWMRSMMNSLLNPKALLFFMVFLPQFVDAGKGSVAQQLMVLGVILTAISVVFSLCPGNRRRCNQQAVCRQRESRTPAILVHGACADCLGNSAGVINRDLGLAQKQFAQF